MIGSTGMPMSSRRAEGGVLVLSSEEFPALLCEQRRGQEGGGTARMAAGVAADVGAADAHAGGHYIRA